MLTICFDINPVARRKSHMRIPLTSDLERWYIGVSVALGMGVPILPAALGHFGMDPILNVWYVALLIKLRIAGSRQPMIRSG
jgi:hypothetical protein